MDTFVGLDLGQLVDYSGGSGGAAVPLHRSGFRVCVSGPLVVAIATGSI